MDGLDEAEQCALRVFKLCGHVTEAGRRVHYKMLTDRDADGVSYERRAVSLGAKGFMDKRPSKRGAEWWVL